MSSIYDNWERLVAAVSKREHLRMLARLPSLSSGSSDSSSEDDSAKSFCFLTPLENEYHLLPHPSDFNQKQVAVPRSSRPASANNRNSSLASRRKRDLRIQVPQPPALGNCLDSLKCCPNTSPKNPSPRLLGLKLHRSPLPRTAEVPSYSTKSASASPPGRVAVRNTGSPGSRWRKGKLISREALGNYYLGFNSETGKHCVMKETSPSYDDARLGLRARILEKVIAFQSQLKHPNVMQYYGSERVDDKTYKCFEYVSGGPISMLMHDFGRLGEPAIRGYTRQILYGLAYLHHKMNAHGDVKASNIFLDPAGGIKLANFCFLENLPALSSTLCTESAHWMAPEVIKCPGKCNSAMDIWSLGCTIVEMATAEKPLSQYKPWNPEKRSTALQLLEHPFVNVTSMKNLALSGSSRLSTEGRDQALQLQWRPGSSPARAPKADQSCSSSSSTSPLISPNSPLSPTPTEQMKVEVSPVPIYSPSNGISDPYCWDPIILQGSNSEVHHMKVSVTPKLTPTGSSVPSSYTKFAPLYPHTTPLPQYNYSRRHLH